MISGSSSSYCMLSGLPRMSVTARYSPTALDSLYLTPRPQTGRMSLEVRNLDDGRPDAVDPRCWPQAQHEDRTGKHGRPGTLHQRDLLEVLPARVHLAEERLSERAHQVGGGNRRRQHCEPTDDRIRTERTDEDMQLRHEPTEARQAQGRERGEDEEDRPDRH